MKLFFADYIFCMDDDFTILKDACVAFDEKIVEVSTDKEKMLKVYKNARVFQGGKNSVLCPGLINSNTHLEYSLSKKNSGYGSFLPWLSNFLKSRNELSSFFDEDSFKKSAYEMLRSGVTSFAEISSFGLYAKTCKKLPQTIVFFNELIGSSEGFLEKSFENFKERFEASLDLKGANFIPAISIHSGYTVHPVNIKRCVELAKKHKMPVCMNFMESSSERKWLDLGKGEFKSFFQERFGVQEPANKTDGFLDLFDGVKMLYVHCIKASLQELDKIQSQGANVVHCPVLNRLLGVGRLDLEQLKNKEIPFCLATAGFKAGQDLNIFNELRAALWIHYELDLRLLAKDLLKSVTTNPASSLGLNKGEIKVGKDADLVCFKLLSAQKTEEMLPLELILYTNKAEKIFINGDEIDELF